MQQERTISRKGLSNKNINFFLAGFVEGEGSFNVSLRKKLDYKIAWQIVMSFNVSQKDPSLLYLLKRTLKCGIIKVRKADGLCSFDVTTPKDVIEIIIPFFSKYPLISKSKLNNFKIFCEIAKIMKNGGHKKITGFRKIVQLREKLNIGKGRTRKYSIKDVFPT